MDLAILLVCCIKGLMVQHAGRSFLEDCLKILLKHLENHYKSDLRRVGLIFELNDWISEHGCQVWHSIQSTNDFG